MSYHSHDNSTPKAEFFDQRHAGSMLLVLPVVGLLALAGSAVWFVIDRHQFAYSWLFAFFFFFTLGVGSMFWTLVHHATDAEWTVVVRRLPENVARLIWITLLFFIPLLFCAPILWKWWNMDPNHGQLADKSAYLNHPFFYGRLVFFFAIFWLVPKMIMRNSVAQDADGHPQYTLNMRWWSFFGIPFMGVCLTFAAIDWLMGMDYRWFSTMWGVYIFAGSAQSSMALLILMVTALKSKGYLKFVTIEHYHIMGKLLLAFCIFWAYIGFDQYMLIWYANLPEETSYFIRRNIGSWNILSTFMVACRFFLPFVFLLQQSVKKTWLIYAVSSWLILMQLLDMYIIVMPMYKRDGFAPSFMDLIALLAIGAPLAFIFLKNLGKQSLFPARDPRLPESLKLSN